MADVTRFNCQAISRLLILRIFSESAQHIAEFAAQLPPGFIEIRKCCVIPADWKTMCLDIFDCVCEIIDRVIR